MVDAAIAPLLKLTDFYGAPLAEFYYLPQNATLYIRWHGNLTAAEVVRGVKASSALMEARPFARVLNDKRDTSGDWSEALPWLEYEWLPQAVAAGLRAIAYVLSPALETQMVSQEFVEAVQRQLHVALFLQEDEARRWLNGQ